MSDSINKIKIWFSKNLQKKNSYDREGIRPTKDWEIILGLTLLAFFVSVVVAGYFYIQVNSNSVFQVDADIVENEVKINKPLLDKTISDINERRKSSDAIKRGGKIPSDPSA